MNAYAGDFAWFLVSIVVTAALSRLLGLDGGVMLGGMALWVAIRADHRAREVAKLVGELAGVSRLIVRRTR